MFRFAQHKMFVVLVFPLLRGDDNTEYDYEVFMLENLVFNGKIREFVFLFVFMIFLLLFKYSSINSYMVFTW